MARGRPRGVSHREVKMSDPAQSASAAAAAAAATASTASTTVPVTPLAAPAAAPSAPQSVAATALPQAVEGRVPAQSRKRLVYEAGGLRKIALSFAFLILLPFFGSLPAMLVQRLGVVPAEDLVGFAVMATGFTLLMLFLLVELVRSIRSRLVLGEEAIRFTLPVSSGIFPSFFHVSHDIPYDHVERVEIQREVYGGALAPVLLKGAAIVLKDGKRIPLGYVSEANDDAVIPFPEIARELAVRAGCPITDLGSIRRAGLGGNSGTCTPLTEAEVSAFNRAHGRVVGTLIACLVVLVTLGVVRDILNADTDQGERAAHVITAKKK